MCPVSLVVQIMNLIKAFVCKIKDFYSWTSVDK